jgi:hypothetical protein
MLEIDLTPKELLEYLDSNNGLFEYDHYRKVINYDDEYFIGIYYKDFEDIDRTPKGVDDRVDFYKEYWTPIDLKNYGMTPKKRKEELIMGIERVQEEYALKEEKATQVISGLVLCHDYPVGVIIPKKFLEYKPLNVLENEIELTDEDINTIFDSAKWWIERLIEKDIYPGPLYGGNILVNPNDYSCVMLEKLDEFGLCRMETKEYVYKIAKRGNNLEANAYKYLEELREDYLHNHKHKKYSI